MITISINVNPESYFELYLYWFFREVSNSFFLIQKAYNTTIVIKVIFSISITS